MTFCTYVVICYCPIHFQELASKLSSISMPLMDHFYFSMAPVDMNKTSVVSALQKVSPPQLLHVNVLIILSLSLQSFMLQGSL